MTRVPSVFLFCVGTAVTALLGCGNWEVKDDAGSGGAAGSSGSTSTGGASGSAGAPIAGPRGLKVVGNRIEDADGNGIVLRGVNRSGTEYQCAKNSGVFDGLATEESVRAMTTWSINAVRVPLNESCWLSINGAPGRYSGENYKAAILDYVGLLHRHGLVPILDLHWVGPGEELALEPLRPMPSEHSPDFWADVARFFRDDDGVIFEPFNEPYPDRNVDSDVAWECWRDGCDVTQYNTTATYPAVGMQRLVDAIRGAGSEHVLLLGGVEYSNGLSRWLEFKPIDPLENLAAAWHVYNNNRCRDITCWNDIQARLAETVPIVATEIGQNDCAGDTFLAPLMQFLDEHQSGYLAWSWNALGACEPAIPRVQQGQPWFLITDYLDPQPVSDYARTFRDHVMGVSP